jgi:HEAT repeat protein
MLAPEHQALLRALDDPSPEARSWAVDELIRVGAPVVPALAECLRHEKGYIRQAAAQALGDIGADAAPALTDLATAAIDREEGVRRVASAVLARVDPAWAIAPDTRRALPAVVEGLRSDLPWVSRAAAALLVRIGRPAVPALAELLVDWETNALRMTVLGILGQIGPSAGEAAPALTDVLASSDNEFRQAAAATLVRLGAAAAPAVPALIRALPDWSPPVRESAAQTLGAVGVGAAHAVPSLLGLLSDWDDKVRAATVAALAGIGEPAVPLLALVLQERDLRRLGERTRFREEVDRLWKRLETEGGHGTPERAWRDLTWFARAGLPDQTEVVHEAAATALGRIGPGAAAAAAVLIQALSDERLPVQLAAARALGEIGPGARVALPSLAAVLVNQTGAVRRAAAEALPRIDGDWGSATDAEVVLPALVARLKDNGPRGAEAADALALIGAAAAPVLVGALASDDRTMHEAAAQTLGRMGPAARAAVPALKAALRDPRGWVREAAAQALARVAPDRPAR